MSSLPRKVLRCFLAFGLGLLVSRRQATVAIPDRGDTCVKIANPVTRKTGEPHSIHCRRGMGRIGYFALWAGQHRNLELVRRTAAPFD